MQSAGLLCFFDLNFMCESVFNFTHTYWISVCLDWYTLTHWGRVTHICVSKQSIIGSDNGLSPGRCQAIMGTNAEILSIRTLGKNFSEILSESHTFSLKKMRLKILSTKCWPFCLGLNVLNLKKKCHPDGHISLLGSVYQELLLDQY